MLDRDDCVDEAFSSRLGPVGAFSPKSSSDRGKDPLIINIDSS